MTDLPSREAARLVLLAEREMFGKLIDAVGAVASGGDWRTHSASAADTAAVEKWLSENWGDGYYDDRTLVDAWLSAFGADKVQGSELGTAVADEKMVAERLHKTVSDLDAQLAPGLSKRTIAAWMKDLGDEVAAKEQFLRWV